MVRLDSGQAPRLENLTRQTKTGGYSGETLKGGIARKNNLGTGGLRPTEVALASEKFRAENFGDLHKNFNLDFKLKPVNEQ